jgi:hypothetical protein
MVAVQTYKVFWEYMLTLVTGITQVKVVIDEEDFMEYLRDVDVETVTLLAVVPASAVEATSSDDYEEIDNIYVYILKKSNPQDLTSDEVLAELNALQTTMTAIKQKLIDMSGDFDHCDNQYICLMHKLIISSMQTAPEYNLMGCNGYGLTFKLKTKGV